MCRPKVENIVSPDSTSVSCSFIKVSCDLAQASRHNAALKHMVARNVTSLRNGIRP